MIWDLTQVFSVGPQFFERAEGNAKEAGEISAMEPFLGLNTLGQNGSVLLGSKGGLMIRFNSGNVPNVNLIGNESHKVILGGTIQEKYISFRCGKESAFERKR